MVGSSPPGFSEEATQASKDGARPRPQTLHPGRQPRRVHLAASKYLPQPPLLGVRAGIRLPGLVQEPGPSTGLLRIPSTSPGVAGGRPDAASSAQIFHPHRNPVETSASLISLFYSVHSRMTERLDVRRMTDAILSFHEHQIARNLAARDAHPGALFDVYYDRLVADPIGTVRDIYDHYDLAWSEEFAERLNYYVQQNPRNKHGTHRYAPEDFGQREEAISERFAAYIERFELSRPNRSQ